MDFRKLISLILVVCLLAMLLPMNVVAQATEFESQTISTDLEVVNELPLNSGTITMANFLSEVGVENVKKYIQELKDDAENGVNLFSAERLNNFKIQNIGGINRQPSTIDDDSDIIENDKNPKPEIEQKADAAKRIQDREKTVRSKMV